MTDRELARFIPKFIINETTGCWEWQASMNKGYGQFYRGGSRQDAILRGAHRVSYEHWIGPVPDGLDLDHLCRVRRCVNPDHLEPVTRRENLLRGPTIPAGNLSKLECAQGHAFDADNTYISPDGARVCRACHRIWARERRAMGK